MALCFSDNKNVLAEARAYQGNRAGVWVGVRVSVNIRVGLRSIMCAVEVRISLYSMR